MNGRSLGSIALAALATLVCCVARAQTPVSENFTGAYTTNQWLPSNGACLTAGNNTGSVPACVGLQYYLGQTLVGGVNGTLPDLVGSGALRFTNGYTTGEQQGICTTSASDPSGQDFDYGFCQNGSIVSAWTFPTDQGIEVQFETVTYRGNSGGSGGDGADGISFYLIDGCMPITGGTVPSNCPSPANAAYGNGSSTFPGIGSWGGSLAYSCSNTNSPYNGLVGAYLGLGIDEYGNFLNGTKNTLDETGSTDPGPDNTATGGYYQPGRIGLRGAGDVAWQALTNAYGTNPNNTSLPYYPASLATSCYINGGTYSSSTGLCSGNPTDAMEAVQHSCATGYLYNYKSPSNPTSAGAMTLPSSPGGNVANTADILDYAAIPGAYKVLSGVQIASESALTRTLCATNATSDKGCVMPIVYDLKITPAGLLSLSYSINGGATQEVIKDQSITAYNGPLPSSFRFGFAGSTGGSANIHEILCFQAQPSSLSEGSAGVNQQPSAKIESGTGAFAYFTYYNPDNWTGRVTADALEVVTDSSGNTTLEVAETPTWDASCVLTVGPCESIPGTTTTSQTVEGPKDRFILTWNGTVGVPFKWSDLSSAEQNAIDSDDLSGDPAGSTESDPWTRVAYLRGSQTNELDSAGTCPAAQLSPSQPCFRERDDILGDIVDSSPAWVGPPSSPYTATWQDRLYPNTTMPENSGQSYAQYVTDEETRTNVVYVGANDGLLHGFRAGAYNSSGTFDTSPTATPNDGYEVLAYMPASVIEGASVQVPNSNPATYVSTVDTIHGTDPTKTESVTSSNAVTNDLDYSNPQYGHNFYVDATPGSGDLYYNSAWHTWLVGGLGAGGAAIYALDVTNPSDFNESEVSSEASSIVVGEWNPQTITCENVANCGEDLGDTYGTPEIRRLHNGTWGVIFGNGFGSETGDAGIYILTIGPTGTQTIYYLSTGTAGGNGIAYVTPVDLDGDHITDYVYAGDLKGNIWRFDLTSSNPANWSITRCLANCSTSDPTTTNAPLFTTSAGQPITTQLVVASGQTPAGAQTLMILFGTGQKYPFTNTGATSFATGTQAIYGIWDWAMSDWNSISSAQYAALTPAASGLASPYTIVAPGSGSSVELQEQTISINTNGDRDISENSTVCWQGTSACSSGTNDQFGWYVDLPGGTSKLPEQIVFNPELVGGALVVNSTIPPANTLLSCTTASQTGYTYALQALSGGAFNNFFPLYNDYIAVGVATNATGTSFPLQLANGTDWLVYQTYQPGTPGTTPPPSPLEINVASNSTGHQLTWTELR